MATLVLTKVFINLLSTGEALSAQSIDRAQTYGIDGEVKTFAGGRQRFVGKEGEHGQFTVKLRRLTLVQVTKLRTWQGLAVQFRDRRGQLFNGVFSAVNVAVEWKDLLYDVELPLRMITVDEGV